VRGSVILTKGQNILIAESAEAARRNAKVFLSVSRSNSTLLFQGGFVRALL
jgi:hypothetical protein